MSYFIFKGVDSRTFGVTSKSAFPPIAERTFKTTEIPGRAEPLNRLDVMRKNSKLAITMSILDVSKLAEINAWLQGEGDLILSDDPTKKYHAYVNQAITPERLLKLYGSIPIVFTVEPFRYSVDNPPVNIPMFMNDDTLTDSMEITYNGTCEGEPLLYFAFAGKLRVTVNNSAEPLILTTSGEYTDTLINGETGSISGGVQTGSSGAITDVGDTSEVTTYRYKYNVEFIYIDCAAKVAYTPDRKVVTNKTAGKFPIFKNGINNILLELLKEEWNYGPARYQSHNQKLEMFGYQKNERWY